MPSTALGFGEVKVRKTLFLLHEAYCVGGNTPKNDQCEHTIASVLKGMGIGFCVYEGGTRESLLREPMSRKLRGVMLYWRIVFQA